MTSSFVLPARRLLLGVFLAAIANAAAPFSADLGESLTYVRLHELPADPVQFTKPSLVLDLRFATGDVKSASDLTELLRARAPRPTFVLVNASTAAVVLAAVPREPGLLIIGLPVPGFAPDLIVKTTAEDDQRAYEALDHGTPVAKLIDDTVANKPRNDEAALAREHRPDSGDDVADSPAPDQPAKETPPVLLDLVLLRAVQLQHAITALKTTGKG